MSVLDCLLIVDDSETDRFLVRLTAEESGLIDHVVEARDGVEALEYLARADSGEAPWPQLILLDVNMPVMGGWEFLEAFAARRADWACCVVVTMLSTSNDPKDVEMARSQGAAAFSEKPLTAERLAELAALYEARCTKPDEDA